MWGKCLMCASGGIRTNIANAAKVNQSLKSLGMHPEKSVSSFNKLLRIPPEEAARQILDAVLKDKRRLLIGNDAKFLDALQRVMPAKYQYITGLLTGMNKNHVTRSYNCLLIY